LEFRERHTHFAVEFPSTTGGEGTVKDDDAPGHLVPDRQGQEVLRRNSHQSQNREVAKAEPLAAGVHRMAFRIIWEMPFF